VAPTPPSRNGRKIAIILTAVLVPGLAICGTFGFFVVKGFKQALDAAATNSPSVPASPTPDITAVPAVGLCYDGAPTDAGWDAKADIDTAVSCANPHQLETIASGMVPDAGETPPEVASAVAGALYDTCGTAANTLLGRPWITTLTWLVVSVPHLGAWEQGAHWYRCDLATNSRVGDMDIAATVGRISDSAVPITCVNWTVNAAATSWSTPIPAGCGEKHNGELAGAVPMPSDVDRTNDAALTARLFGLCDPVVFSYLGRSSLPSTLDVWFYYPTDTRQQGELEQYVECLVAATDLHKSFTGSLKGIGSKPIPFAN
jgi:hypothetical protein